MKSTVLLLVNFLVLIAKIVRPGGIRALIAEHLIRKHQVTMLNRARQKAPKLKVTDRFVFGILLLVVARKRLRFVAVVNNPATLLKYHRSLIRAVV